MHEGDEAIGGSPVPETLGQGIAPSKKPDILILFVAAQVKEIFDLGRDYPWPRPRLCPRCEGSRLWGHGFVEAFFDGFDESIVLRRYRCPVCDCVIRLRPAGYLSRFQASIESIHSRLSHRIRCGRWPPGLCRQRQGHWLRALRRKAEAYLSKAWKGGLMEAFDELVLRGHNPVSRAI